MTIRTSGDVHTHVLPARLMGKGFFTKEIEDALLAGDVDLAVHSLKDLPTEWPAGLTLGAIPLREDPRDALVGKTLADLAGASDGSVTIGTSSLRRQAQLKRTFPECEVVNLRGNLDTRLRKVREGVVDCAVLAAAGLCRLGREREIDDFFAGDQMLSAPGQGALAIEIRSDDSRLQELLAAVHDEPSAACVTAERAFMSRLGGGCQLPVAALATVRDGVLNVQGRVLSLDGRRLLEGRRDGFATGAAEIGRALADSLLAQGAGEMIREIEQELQQGPEHG